VGVLLERRITRIRRGDMCGPLSRTCIPSCSVGHLHQVMVVHIKNPESDRGRLQAAVDDEKAEEKAFEDGSPQGALAYDHPPTIEDERGIRKRKDAFAGPNPLFVKDLFGTHRVVMNKFPVMKHHVRPAHTHTPGFSFPCTCLPVLFTECVPCVMLRLHAPRSSSTLSSSRCNADI